MGLEGAPREGATASPEKPPRTRGAGERADKPGIVVDAAGISSMGLLWAQRAQGADESASGDSATDSDVRGTYYHASPAQMARRSSAPVATCGDYGTAHVLPGRRGARRIWDRVYTLLFLDVGRYQSAVDRRLFLLAAGHESEGSNTPTPRPPRDKTATRK